MSDGDDFDREAERERLREKYERDQAEREATEQMSELLLQGATMTNQHCPECHSPVFRYDGQEFCPTCQREVTEDGELVGEDAGGEAAAGDGTAADAATNGETGASADERREPAAEEAAPEESAETGTAPGGNRQPTDGDAGAAGTAGPHTGTDAERAPEPTEEPPAETRPAPARERRPARVDPPARREEPTSRRDSGLEGVDLGEAEAALVREITNLTRRAEETRDVGRKRDFFAAAREATETLRELRRL